MSSGASGSSGLPPGSTSSGAGGGAAPPAASASAAAPSSGAAAAAAGPAAPGATTGPSTSPLLAEFELAYADLILPLAADENGINMPSTGGGAVVTPSDEERLENFVSLARKLETFFLQKRLLIHNYRPEEILKEDSRELKQELLKKDELIKRVSEKLGQWQTLLQQGQGQQSQSAGSLPQTGQGPSQGAPARHAGPGNLPAGAMPMHPGAPMAPGVGAPQGGFVPGNNYRMQLNPMSNTPMAGMASPMGVGGHHVGGGDPLNYLERATANVGNMGTPPMK